MNGQQRSEMKYIESFVVYPTSFMSSVMKLFHKLFSHSEKINFWTTTSHLGNQNADDENSSDTKRKNSPGTDSNCCYTLNGKLNGRAGGIPFQKLKQRHFLSRREFSGFPREKKRGNTSMNFANKSVNEPMKKTRQQLPSIASTTTTHISNKRQQHIWFIHMLVIITCIICYRNSLHGDFVHDDLSAIKSNGDVTGQNNIWKIFSNDFWGKAMAEQTSHKSYRPLTILTFRLNCYIGDLEPYGFHLVNVFLHIAVCLVYTKVCLEVVKASRTSTIISATHFAAHPIHTEAVSGIVGRADVLSSLFVLMSFLQYHRCHKEKENRGLLLSIILACGAMLSKEHGITVLGINFCWDIFMYRKKLFNYIWRHEKKSKELTNMFNRLFIIILGGIVFMGFRVMMLKGSLPHFSDQDNPASFSKSKLTRFRTYAYLPVFNVWLLIAPISLSYDWQMGSIPLITSWIDVRNIISLTFYTLLFFTFLQAKRKTRKDVVVGLTFLIIPFIPASNLFFRVGFVVAERVLYMPSLGFSLLVGMGTERIMNQQQKFPIRLNLIKALFFVILLLFANKTRTRNQDWKSRESLFTSGLRLLPYNAKMHYNYANLQKDLGNTSLAIHHYQEALSLWPSYASAHNNLGTLLNDSTAAESHFQQALRINPLHPHALYNLANLKHRQGKTKLGVQLMERSLELEPTNTDALTNLAAMLADLGQIEKANGIHLNILQLETNNPDHLNNYGAFLQKIGRLDEALQFYQEALLRDANHTVALLNTARLMKKLKLNDKAESLYQRALLKDDDPQAKDGLGVLYLNTGRANQAEQLFREALERTPDDPTVKLHLAQAQVHQRKYSEAETLLLSVVEHSSRREVLHQLATLYNQLNRTAEAVRYIQLAVLGCPNSEVACAPIHAFHGDLSKDLEDLDAAVTSYRTAVSILGDCSGQQNSVSSTIITHVHLNLGAIYHVQGKFQDAWRHYKEALNQDPYNQVLLQNIAKLKKAERQLKESMTKCLSSSTYSHQNSTLSNSKTKEHK